MASTLSGIKTGSPTTAGTSDKVVAAVKSGHTMHAALSMGGKPKTDVRV